MRTPYVELILDFVLTDVLVLVFLKLLNKKKLTVPQFVPASTEVENVVHRDMR